MIIVTQEINSYNKMLSDCAGKNTGIVDGCYDSPEYLWGKTMNYAVMRIGDEDFPEDLSKYYDQIPQIKDSFKTL
jgi:hypothetical protein